MLTGDGAVVGRGSGGGGRRSPRSSRRGPGRALSSAEPTVELFGDAVEEFGPTLGCLLLGDRRIQVRVVVLVILIDLRFVGPGLTEELRAQGVRVEGLHVDLLGLGEIEHLLGGRVTAGDQVRAAVAQTQVQDLDLPGPFPRGQFAGRGGHLSSVLGRGHEDGDIAIQDLVAALQDHVLIR